jgi:mono/diheme cytochrome c family protein
MHDQPKYEAQGTSRFFADGRAARPLVEGTVAQGQLADEPGLNTGKVGTGYVRGLPMPVTTDLLRRGRERYDIYCSVCHDRVGRGRGLIVQRGFRTPPSLHEPRLREQSDGYLFEVISKGFGVMPDYAQQIRVADRWAIVAYVRALQLSQNATLADVPDGERARLSREAQ